jgi:hypothetical protein
MDAELVKIVEHLQTREKRRIVAPLIALMLAAYRQAWRDQRDRSWVVRGRAILPALEAARLVPVLEQAYTAGVTIAEASLVGPVIPGLAFDRAEATKMVADLDKTSQVMASQIVARAEATGADPEQVTTDLLNLIQSWGTDRALTAAEWSVSTALHQGMQDYVDGFIASAQGVLVMKRWSVNPGACEICIGNAADGWIDSDANFASGADNAPQHPNCNCSIDYKTSIG